MRRICMAALLFLLAGCVRRAEIRVVDPEQAKEMERLKKELAECHNQQFKPWSFTPVNIDGK